MVRPGSRVLDVGCAEGYLSAELIARGCDVIGVEPDARAAAVARERRPRRAGGRHRAGHARRRGLRRRHLRRRAGASARPGGRAAAPRCGPPGTSSCRCRTSRTGPRAGRCCAATSRVRTSGSSTARICATSRARPRASWPRRRATASRPSASRTRRCRSSRASARWGACARMRARCPGALRAAGRAQPRARLSARRTRGCRAGPGAAPDPPRAAAPAPRSRSPCRRPRCAPPRRRSATDTARDEPVALEEQADAVVGRPAAGQRARAHRLAVDGQPVGVAVGGARDNERGRRPSPAIGSGRPPDFVTPPANQHIAPALRPASTMPRSHASRSIASRPCSRQIASMLRIEPPPT